MTRTRTAHTWILVVLLGSIVAPGCSSNSPTENRLKTATAPATSDSMEFFALVQNGNVMLAEDLLAKSPALEHITDMNGRSPLHIAAEYNEPEMVEFLLKRGADPNSKDDAQLTPLALTRSAAVGKLLINAGAKLEQIGLTPSPLHMAAKEGSVEMVTLLLDKGARPDSAAFGNVTPLVAAVESGNAEVVRILLDHGATPGTTMMDGQTPLSIARKQKESYAKIEELLTSRLPKN